MAALAKLIAAQPTILNIGTSVVTPDEESEGEGGSEGEGEGEGESEGEGWV